jgi:hypothetical protein
MHLVGVDDPREQVDQQALLLQGERRQDPCLSGEQLGTQISPQFLPAGGGAQFPRAPVGAVDAPIDQTLGLQLVDDVAHIGSVNAHQPRKLALINPREIVQAGKGRILQRPQLFADIHLRKNGRADLLEAAR